jgi:hypothetical protein
MDKWEALQQEIKSRLVNVEKEALALVEEARSDALVDELAKISTAIGRLDGRLLAIEQKLSEKDDD